MINCVANNYDVNFMYNQVAPQRVQLSPVPPKEPHHQDKSKQIAQKTSTVAAIVMLLGILAYYLKYGKSAPNTSLTQVNAGNNLSILG